MRWGTRVVVVVAAVLPFVGAGFGWAGAGAADPRCNSLFLMRSRAAGTTNPVPKPTLPGLPVASPVTPPAEPQGVVDLAWGRNVSEPGTPAGDLTNKYCWTHVQASSRGADAPTAPTDMRVIEPGTQIQVSFYRHFGPETYPISVRFVGTGMTFSRTITAEQSCFITCGSYESPWMSLPTPPTGSGHYVMTVVAPNGTVFRGCARTVDGTCPF